MEYTMERIEANFWKDGTRKWGQQGSKQVEASIFSDFQTILNEELSKIGCTKTKNWYMQRLLYHCPPNEIQKTEIKQGQAHHKWFRCQ